MFQIFRRKDRPALAYGILQKFGELVERGQRKIAAYLNRKTSGYGKRKWMLCLGGFCLSFGGMATMILFSSISGKRLQNTRKLYPQSITVPSSVLQQDKAWDSLQLMEEIYRHRKDSVLTKQ